MLIDSLGLMRRIQHASVHDSDVPVVVVDRVALDDVEDGHCCCGCWRHVTMTTMTMENNAAVAVDMTWVRSISLLVKKSRRRGDGAQGLPFDRPTAK